jgi:hypothetical protein
MNRQNVVPLPVPDQLTLHFEPGIVERFPAAMDVVRKVAYGHRNPLKTLAADMDMSESTLSRKLAQNPDDPRRFGLDDLERFVRASGDVTVIEYLAAKYLQTDSQRRESAISAAEGLLRELSAILPALKGQA